MSIKHIVFLDLELGHDDWGMIITNLHFNKVDTNISHTVEED